MSKLQEPFRYDYVGSFLRNRKISSKTKRIRLSCDHGWRISKNLLAFGFYVGI